MNLVKQAMRYATDKHVLDNRQLYGEVLPYTHHLQDVYKILVDFGVTSEAILTAAWLHDVVEDTRKRNNEVKVRDIEELFGAEVAVLVEAVTSEEGPNRKTRNALTYPKIRAAGADAITLKLADRLANVRFAGGAVEMYRKENADFMHGLGFSDEHVSMDPGVVDLLHRSVLWTLYP